MPQHTRSTRQPQRSQLTWVALCALGLAVVLVLCVSDVAHAASGGSNLSQAGQNFGNAIGTWGKALLLTVAGLMGIGVLVKRNVAEGMTLLALVVVLGGFLYAPTATESFISNLWNSVA
jgi:hypothetical protein